MILFIRKITYYLYRWATHAAFWGRRRLTRAGLAVLAGLAVVALASTDISMSLAYQAFMLLFCLLAVAWVGTWRFALPFSARRVLPRFGTVGTPVAYRVFLRNQSKKTQAGLLLLEELADSRPGFEEFVAIQVADERALRSFSLSRKRPSLSFGVLRVPEAPVPTVTPGGEVEVKLEFTPLKRGPIRFEKLTVARPDPLGLMKAGVRQSLPQTLLVLPKRYPLPPIALPGLMKYQPGGVAMASSVGESEEFIGVRDYRPGDPLRHIHWRSWARHGQPIVREFEDEFFVRHALVLDTFLEVPHSEVFEEAVSIAASFACTVVTQESLLDLLFVGAEAYCFTSGRGLAHREQMLEILAGVKVCRTQPFALLEDLVLRHSGDVSGVICVLLAWDEARQTFVRKLRELGVPLVVLVVREAGGPPLHPGPMRDAPSQFHVLLTGAIEEGLASL